MTKPRAALAAAIVLFSSLPAHAFTLKRSSTGADVRWSARRVEWTVDPSMDALAGGADVAAEIASQWSEREGAPRLVVARASAPREPGYDGVSGTIFAPEGFEPAGHALAVTIVSFDDRTGAILDADVVVNGKYRFERLDRAGATEPTARRDDGDPGGREVDQHDAPDDRVYDIARVVAHETGHALGLGDEPANADAVMYPYVAAGKLARTAPSEDDLSGLAVLYDPPSSDRSRHACSVAFDRREGAWPIALAVAFAFAVVARRRGRGAAARAGLFLAALVVPPMGAPAPTRALVARARVTRVETEARGGVLRSTATLATTSCLAAGCPERMTTTTWGGVLDGVRQEVAGRPVLRAGDVVDVELGAIRGRVARITRARDGE
jgi:hypothetical protein